MCYSLLLSNKVADLYEKRRNAAPSKSYSHVLADLLKLAVVGSPWLRASCWCFGPHFLFLTLSNTEDMISDTPS